MGRHSLERPILDTKTNQSLYILTKLDTILETTNIIGI